MNSVGNVKPQQVIAMATAILAGALFAGGLVISGMSNPANVLGFLDIAGFNGTPWNPNLALVMASAIAVYAPVAYLVRRRGNAVLASQIQWPLQTSIDAKLITGATMFGIGWGLSGYCPGPALVAVTSGATSTIAFVMAMASGMVAFQLFAKRSSLRDNNLSD